MTPAEREPAVDVLEAVVARLREVVESAHPAWSVAPDILAACDLIDALAAERDALRAALAACERERVEARAEVERIARLLVRGRKLISKVSVWHYSPASRSGRVYLQRAFKAWERSDEEEWDRAVAAALPPAASADEVTP